MLLANGTLEILRVAPYGAYAMNMDQKIMLWNRTAEVVTGHRADQVIGRRCYEVLQNRPQGGNTTVCMEGCPSILLSQRRPDRAGDERPNALRIGGA